MNIEEAIKKAVEGGYDTTNATGITWSKLFPDDYETFQADILLDPSFWRSLGKALEWKLTCPDRCVGGLGALRGNMYISCTSCGNKGIEGWSYQWHRFIDHLAEGKSAESFFQNLQ